jgi:hypothetical protein
MLRQLHISLRCGSTPLRCLNYLLGEHPKPAIHDHLKTGQR